MDCLQLDRIRTCAEAIISVLGPRTTGSKTLSLSDRELRMPDVTLLSLIGSTVFAKMDPETRRRTEHLVQSNLDSTRLYMSSQYRMLRAKLHSPQRYGIADAEVEDHTARLFEASYSRHLRELRKRLRSLLASEGLTEHEQPRGGFGDVSHIA